MINLTRLLYYLKKEKSTAFFNDFLKLYIIHPPSTSYEQNPLFLLFSLYFFKLDGVLYLAIKEALPKPQP